MNKYALITGASGGIGYELAKIAASQKYNLILIARSANKLEQIKNEFQIQHQVEVINFVADLTNQKKIDEIINELQNKNIIPEILINNAGFGLYGKFEQTNWATEENMIQLNILSLVHFTKKLLPLMLKTGKGYIMNVASVAAFMPGPYMSVYYATKAFVLSFSQALNSELKGSGISVTAFCPGPTQTGFEEAAALTESKLFKRMPIASAKAASIYGFNAMKKRKAVAIHGFMNKMMILQLPFFPRNLVTWMVKKIQS
jgi:uncharacterized protein